MAQAAVTNTSLPKLWPVSTCGIMMLLRCGRSSATSFAQLGPAHTEGAADMCTASAPSQRSGVANTLHQAAVLVPTASINTSTHPPAVCVAATPATAASCAPPCRARTVTRQEPVTIPRHAPSCPATTAASPATLQTTARSHGAASAAASGMRSPDQSASTRAGSPPAFAWAVGPPRRTVWRPTGTAVAAMTVQAVVVLHTNQGRANATCNQLD